MNKRKEKKRKEMEDMRANENGGKVFLSKSLNVEDGQDLPALILPCDEIVVVSKNAFEKTHSTMMLVNDGFHVYLILYPLVVPNFQIV